MFLFFASKLPVQANIFDWNLWSADKKLQEEKFAEAKDKYLRIQVKDPDNPRVNYNSGIALYRLGSYAQAINSFSRAAEKTDSHVLQQKSLYNLGNSFFQLEDYKKAIEAYEKALQIDAEDEDTKHNLELAKKKLKENENKKKDENKKNEGDQKQDQDENDDQDKNDQNENQDDQDKDKENQDQSKSPKDKQQQNNKNQKQNQKESKTGLSQQDIERLLMQVQEAKPQDVKQNRGQSQNKSKAIRLNPW